MIVVDTNVIAYLWLPSPHTELAEKVFQKDSEWLVPGLWKAEFRNVLVQYIKRGLPMEAALRIMEKTEEQMHGLEIFVESKAVLELAMSSGCTSYDCEFVYVAKLQAVPLITFDRQVLQKFPNVALSPEQFLL
jgi:predicted nucleic acid-binding protein